jgi:hypothetical protein
VRQVAKVAYALTLGWKPPKYALIESWTLEYVGRKVR